MVCYGMLWGMVGAHECDCNGQMMWYLRARSRMDVVDVYKIKLANLLVTRTCTDLHWYCTYR
jgi:hypothetical protein